MKNISFFSPEKKIGNTDGVNLTENYKIDKFWYIDFKKLNWKLINVCLSL